MFVSLNEHLAYLRYDTYPEIPTVRVCYTKPYWPDEDWHKAHVHRASWSFAGPVKLQCLNDL